MRKFIGRFLAAIGALTLLSVLVVIAMALFTQKSVPNKIILEVNFDTALAESAPGSTLTSLMRGDQLTLRDVVDAIDKAALDDRVAGIVAKISDAAFPPAQTQELRDAVTRFRAKKKFAVAYADTFGEFGPANSAYYLASAFESIYMQPTGSVGLTGILLESFFLKGTFDKLDVQMQGGQRHEYKNAYNSFTETKFTTPHKEAMTGIATSWFNQMKSAICDARKIAPEECQTLTNGAPYHSAEAVKAKLVDALIYRDEVYDKVTAKAGKDAELLYLERYLERVGRPHESGEKIALVFAVGEVVRGESSVDPLEASENMGSESVAAAIRTAVDDKDVKAIVLRIDSPGGSYIGSDTIWREVVRAKKLKKPLIASMGNVAGSGGYYIAMAAEKIVAQPGTLTGSIGIYGGKMMTRNLWAKLGITWDEVHVGENAAMWTGVKDFTPEQKAKFDQWLDAAYDDFTNKVAEGRKLTKEKVLEIAKGRIWTGQDAKGLGLVDELGGYETALRLAKQSAGIPVGDNVRLEVYPRAKGLLDEVLGLRDADSSNEEAARMVLSRALSAMRLISRNPELMSVTAELFRSEDSYLRAVVPTFVR